MAKASTAQNVFEGEFSPLAEGRTDTDRYARAMRYMSNMVPCRTGPATGRSGTYYEQTCIEPGNPSKLLPFEYNEEETLILEFGHYLLRFQYEYNGIAAYREVSVSAVYGTNPFQFYAPGNDFVVGEHITFSNFPAQLNVNGRIFAVTANAGGVVTTDGVAGGDTYTWGGSPVAAIVYEIATPYSRDDVQNLRIAQELNVCYLFCTKTDKSGDYQPYYLSRYDTFNWALLPFPLQDGPFLDINTTTTYLLPGGTGTWIPNMTSNTTPSPYVCAASSEVAGHPAWNAFDNDIDSYWEGNASQSGWLSFQFENAFVNSIPIFGGSVNGAMTISADSQSTGNEAWRASDASANTHWISNQVLPQSWYIDLGAAQTVREYAIRAPKPQEWLAPRNFTLSGSNTGTGGPWTTVDTRTGMTWDSGERKQFTVQSPASFRYYRINTTAVNRNHIVTIHPQVGVKGKKGYVPRHTTTTLTNNFVGFTQIQMSYGSGTPKCVDGYTIYLGRYNKGQDVINHAPRTWYFEGQDYTGTWNLLDSRQNYTTWNNYRSHYFALQNREAYKAYRIRIQTVNAPGDVNPRIGKLVMSSPDAPAMTLTATSKIGINDNQGFLPTDVGRQIRVRDADNIWRYVFISAVSSTYQVSLRLVSADPLILAAQVKFWRLGLWSDTTGWPTCGTLHEDRLWVSGAMGKPDHVIGSYMGRHMLFQQITPDDTVLDASAIVLRCNSRYMSRVVWLKSAVEALRVGTGKNEFVISTPTDAALTSTNVKVRITTKRGSIPHEPVYVDNDVVFLQTGGRALYNLNFTYTLGGTIYKSTLMSKLGTHLMSPPVVQIVYQQEPHSVIWGRRNDGSVVGMTYSNDDDIFGGHRHDFAGGDVQDICSLYSPTDKQDSLWIVVGRLINGQVNYYIERLYRFWDYADILTEDATFVDCALRYGGTTPTSVVYGLNQLEGQNVNVLADSITYLNQGPVTHGKLTLQRPATYIVAGLPMTMQGEIISPEAGAQDGTAQGKSKRPHSVVLRLWESARGEVGRWDEDHGELMWTPCEYNFPADENTQDITLRTCLTKTIVLPGGYGTLGTVAFRQQEPLPLNVAGVYPQLVVEDER